MNIASVFISISPAARGFTPMLAIQSQAYNFVMVFHYHLWLTGIIFNDIHICFASKIQKEKKRGNNQ